MPGIRDESARHDIDSSLLEHGLGVASELLGKCREQAVMALRENDPREIGTEFGVVPPEHEPEELLQRARVLGSRRASADDETPPPAPFLVGYLRGALEARERVVAQGEGVAQRLHPAGRRLQPLVAEVVVRAAGRENEIVVGDLLSGLGADAPPGRVEAADARLMKADILRSAKDRPERPRDVGRREQCAVATDRRGGRVELSSTRTTSTGFPSSAFAHARPPNPHRR